MDTEERCLVAEFESMAKADIALQVLETASFTNETVSVVSRNDERSAQEIGKLQDEPSDSPPTGKATGIGGMVGGSVGTVLGTATMIGPFMVAGPLVGMAIGAGTAGVLASTERWGVKKDAAQTYETKVKEGSVLILVTGDEIRLTQAERLLKTTDPKSMERFDI